MNIAGRIEMNPKIHHYRPVTTGIRAPVYMVLGLLGKGLFSLEFRNDKK